MVRDPILARGLASRRPPTDTVARISVRPRHRFRIASVSKALTAVAVLELVERGLLDLDDRPFAMLGHLAPTDGPSPDPRLAEITVGQLLRHRGGFDRSRSVDPTLVPGGIARALGVEPPVDLDQIIGFMYTRPLDFDPGAGTVYSNFGYGVLGRVVEEVSGRSYEAFVREEVLRPAGAAAMALGRNFPAQRPEDEVAYYHPPPPERVPAVPPGEGEVPLPDGGFDLGVMAAHGGWTATASDLVRFLAAVDGVDRPPDVLSPATVELMASPPAGAEADDTYQGMAWTVRPPAEGRPEAWWHVGDLPGTTALLMRSGRTTWALLLNRSPWSAGAHRTIREALESAGRAAGW